VYQEGIQYPLVKLYSRGAVVDDVLRLVLQNTRFPRLLRGDLNAQLAACIKARGLYEGLAAKHGWDTLRAALVAIWRRSELIARAALRGIPDGEYTAEALMDNDGRPGTPPVHIRVRVVVRGEEMTIDLSGLDPQTAGATNAGRYGGAYMAAKIAFKYVASPADPVNDATFRPLHVEIPDGTFLSATPPAAMARYNNAIPTVIDTILRALAPVLPERVAAGHHGAYNTYTFFGTHPATGERYQQFDLAQGGWGGARHRDGFSPLKTLTHGDTQDIPVEVLESLYPLRVERYAFRPDSAGPGTWRGGLGTERRFRTLHACNLNVNFDRTKCLPWGLFGGESAASGGAEIVSAPGADPVWLEKASNVALQAGATATVRSGGGGGYGDPWARDPALVARDVAYGYVSAERARTDYGCVVDPATLALDGAGTARLRAEGRS
jgi:N-methylhydantoinase B